MENGRRKHVFRGSILHFEGGSDASTRRQSATDVEKRHLFLFIYLRVCFLSQRERGSELVFPSYCFETEIFYLNFLENL